ncbi:MAG TPA: putative maltokinase, partial [Gemmatimonadales bacterium]|nr:putative maltokinase [Gemmatimonadales bacterium]
GDNIYLGDRNGVRTPMQWSPDRNAGFSRADPQRLYLPPIMDAIYGYEAVNVEAQSREPNSLLNWMRRLLAVRKTSQAFGRGKLTFLRPGNRKVLAYLREYGEEIVLCVANLGRSAQPVELDLSRFRGRVPVEMLGRTPFPPIGELPYLLTLPLCGFYWFRLAPAGEVDAPSWHEERMGRDDLPVMVLFDGWTSFFRNRVVPWRIGMAVKTREQLETDVLARHVEAQRWYAAKGTPVKRANLADWALWEAGRSNCMIALLEVEGGPETATYFAPLTLAWEDRDEERVRALGPATIAKVRQQAQVGVIADALADEAFCHAVVAAIGEGREIAMAQGKLRFAPTNAFAAIAGEGYAELPVGRPKTLSSNTAVTFGDRLFFKGYRRIRAGINPEFEVGRFLTERTNFASCVPVAGAIEYTAGDGTTMTLGLLQAYASNQGDGWTYTLDYLERFFDQNRAATATPAEDAHGVYLALVRTLGQRTGELHRAFAASSGDPGFDPEPVAPEEFSAWKAGIQAEAAETLELLERNLKQLVLPARDAAHGLLAQRAVLAARVEQCAPGAGPALKMRYHGDYHLGQVLLSKQDFLIVDFEGEPTRPFSERRRKHSPLRDVAGMARSFDYARWTALRNVAQSPEEHERFSALAGAWHDASLETFLAAYAGATKDGGLYASFADARALLALFQLEKALYELRYEINNRPGWVQVPLQGILALINADRPAQTA